MNNFAIGIVGGTGGIGKWFAAFFKAEGHPVHVTGRSTGMPLPELAAACRVVIVSVPIAATAETIRRIGPHLSEESLLMDFTSLKEEPVREMQKATAAEVVGCHPLFGPDCPSLAGQNVILCPGRGERWLTLMKGLFTKGGARVTLTTPAQHDRMMSLVQGLTHLDTILMGLALRDSDVDPSELAAFSTPVFRTKQAIIDKVFGPQSGLYAALLSRNPNMHALLEIFERNFLIVKEMILQRNTRDIEKLLRR